MHISKCVEKPKVQKPTKKERKLSPAKEEAKKVNRTFKNKLAARKSRKKRVDELRAAHDRMKKLEEWQMQAENASIKNDTGRNREEKDANCEMCETLKDQLQEVEMLRLVESLTWERERRTLEEENSDSKKEKEELRLQVLSLEDQAQRRAIRLDNREENNIIN